MLSGRAQAAERDAQRYYNDRNEPASNREFVPYKSHYFDPTAAENNRLPLRSPFFEVVSPGTIKEHERSDVVNEIPVAAGSVLGKRKGNCILAPHRYVIRGNHKDKINMEEAEPAMVGDHLHNDQ